MTEIKKSSDKINRLEIDKVEDRLTVAKILIANKYTVRQVAVKSGNGKKGTTYLEFYKEN